LEKQILAALALALVLAAAVAVYRGMESGHQDNVAATDQQKTLERGALVYVEHCASCHGNYGEGTSTTDGPPVRGTQLTLNDVRRAVQQGTRAFPDTYHVYGRAGGGPLSDAQVEDVSFFIMNWDAAVLDAARGAPVQAATELTDSGLDPAAMEMKAGELVRLVVANFSSSASTCRGDGLIGRSVVEEGAEATEQEVALEVAAGETKSLEFTPVSPGSYRFLCTPSGAGAVALQGTITVTR
jgi:mono/diheme cytochrome c family protein